MFSIAFGSTLPDARRVRRLYPDNRHSAIIRQYLVVIAEVDQRIDQMR